MSSDNYFENDSIQINSAFLEEIDAMEAALTHEKPTPTHPRTSKHSDTIDYDNFFDDLDPAELEMLEQPAPLSRAAKESCPTSLLRQRTLFGDIVPETHSNSHKSVTPGAGAKKVKQWDYSFPIYSKSKINRVKVGVDMDMDKEEGDWGNNGNLTFSNDYSRPVRQTVSPLEYPNHNHQALSFKHEPDLLLAKHWIYPTNKPKRDYQFNIVRESLFENSLVSLPTGLGKTFIAGVIMLNYYRWFPNGKVVFVAPTKPLVAQQIDACHKICGIPGSHSTELTGQTPKSRRAEFWREKRVFFMTPQTFMNDLKSETCNPADIVLLVIDEAHRGTGNYAYAQIVRYLMIKNGHFRVLALTATPGSSTEAVQKIIDALHISHIEIRDENSLDLFRYILPKKITTHTIKMSEDINRVCAPLAKLMNKVAKRVVELGLMPGLDVLKLHPYRCTAVQMECKKSGMTSKFPFLFGTLNQLRNLARAMGYLIECSLKMCYNDLQGLLEDTAPEVKKSKLVSDPLFQDVIKELERQYSRGLSPHPKIDKVTTLALDYFTLCDEQHDPTDEDTNTVSKMMVFANYRMVVDEIVEALNQHQPIIRATRFVGQGTDKQGNKGIVQREQLEIIQRFKEGEFNVLVATSIGEEGLDIGEVDCIICYDAQKTPIRMLQRIGRTGRLRSGRVEVLLSEHREETNWEKARNDYENVQKAIIRGDSLQLYADVQRLLPAHLKPVCQETLMPIEMYTRETKEPTKNPKSPKGKKRKVESIPKHHIPPGTVDGFIPSSKLLAKTSNKRRKLTPANENSNSTRAISKRRGPLSTKLAGERAIEPTLSQLDQEFADDSDDKDLELGIEALLKGKRPDLRRSPSIIAVDSVSSDITEEQSPERTKNHSWLLDSDPIDNALHESEKPNLKLSHPLVLSSSPSSSEPIRAPRSRGIRQRKRVASEVDGSSQLQMPFVADAPGPQYFDLEAEVSGEDSSDEFVSEAERESDRRFLEELSPSQKLPSYNQTVAYQQSLLTQVVPTSQVPEFRSKITRNGRFGPIRPLPRAPYRSSSPNRSTDRYSFDSFLVEDEDEGIV